MKLNNCIKGQQVLFFGYARGGYHNGHDATIIDTEYVIPNGSDKGEVVDGFVTVKLDSAGDILPAHPKQLKKTGF